MRHDLAHRLWGWGSVAEVVKLHAVPAVEPATPPAPTMAHPKNWAELVKFRNIESVRGTVWPLAQAKILFDEFERRQALPGARRVAEEMAGELPSSTPGKTLSISGFNRIKAKATSNEPGKRESRWSKSA